MMLKIPNHLSCSIHLQKSYLAYLWLKVNFQSGVLPDTFTGDQRNFFNYWRKKLIRLGWVYEWRGRYHLRAYQFVWRSMGVKKVKVTKKNRITKKQSTRPGFRFIEISFKYSSRKEFISQTLKHIRLNEVEYKKNQIAYRLLHRTFCSHRQKLKLIRAIRKSEKPMFSSSASAKMFGYKSESSGYQLLLDFFKVTNQPEKTTYLSPSNLPFYRFNSYQISLV